MAGTAFDSSALTLGEYATSSNDPIVHKITFSLHNTLNVLQDIPLQTQPTFIRKGVKFIDNLPSVNWKPLGSIPTVTKGKPTPYEDQVWIVRNQFQVDEMVQNEQNSIGNFLETQIDAWMEAFQYDMNTKFFLNAHDGSGGVTGDPNGPVGLKFRLDNASTYGVASEMKIDFAGTDMTTSMTATTANTFIENLQQVLDYMNTTTGDGVVIYMNDTLKRRFDRAIRVAGLGAGFAATKDAFDRSVDTYKNAKIRDVGRQVDQTTRVLGNESATGAAWTSGSKYTSMYAVRYGAGYFGGWQYRPLKPQRLGLDPTNGVAYNVVVNWAVGFWQEHTRAIARGYDIKIA